MGEVPHEVETWLRGLARRSAHEVGQIDLEDETVQILVGQQQVALGRVPTGWSVLLRSESSLQVVAVLAGSLPPDVLTITAWPTLTRVAFQTEAGVNNWPRRVGLELVAAAENLQLDSGEWVFAEMEISNGSIKAARGFSPQILVLDNAGIDRALSIPSRMVISGAVQLPDGLRAANTEVSGDSATISRSSGQRPGVGATPRPVHLGRVSATDDGACAVEVESGVVLDSIADGSRLHINEQGIVEIRGAACTLSVSGSGSVRIADGREVDFAAAEKLTMRLEAGDSVTDASGSVRTLEAQGGVLTGSERDPVAPSQIGVAKGAELHNVDLSQLESLASLQALEEATRVSPATASGFAELRTLADTRPSAMTVSGRQVFWAQLSDLAATKKASGSVQSNLRFLASQSRRNAADERSREEAWLWLYSRVHYGESIGRPLVLHLCAAALVLLLALYGVGSLEPAQPVITAADVGDFYWDLVVSPLSFFRFVEADVIEGGWWSEFAAVALRIEGVLMLFFSIAAVRRITKAE